VLERVAVHEYLSDIGALLNLLLDLVGRDVLSLGELEDVLLSVDDLEGTARQEHANITGVHPARLVEGVASLLRLTEVAFEGVVAAVADLATGEGDALLVFVLTCVVHVGHVDKLNDQSREWTSDVAAGRVLRPSQGGRRTALSLAIAFMNLAAECDLEELKHLL